MAAVSKIDSNITGLRYCIEQSIGVLPGSPVWTPLEPNEYKDFGGQLALTSRNPINPSRQRKKGVITDLDASGAFSTDITQRNLQEMLQGFMFADTRVKNTAVAITAVSGANVYSLSNTTGIMVGSLVLCAGFANAANNGLKVVSAVSANVSFTSTTGTSVIETPPATATVTVVGYRATAAADIQSNAASALPALTSTTSNFVSMGLTAGEWVFVGGDAVGNQFATAVNNGFKRISAVAATRLDFDKSSTTMTTDTATGKSIDIYFGKVLKNETGTLIKRRTFHLERTLGAPDDAQPTQIQSEYLVGAVPNELVLNIGTADKITADLSFVATNNEQRTGVTGVKSGTRPALMEADAFNTSSDFSRMKIAVLNSANANPTALMAYLTELTLTVSNNVSPNKAISVLGAFDVTAGTFAVSGQMTAYFADVAAIAAVRANSSVTLDLAIVKNNAGMVIDIPVISLGDGRAAIKKDEPITLPLSADASTGASFNANMDHTLMFVFYDYLPTLADV